MQIGSKKAVRFTYTLTDAKDGTVLDTSDGGEPMSYLHGASAIVPGLEKALEGKSPGDAVEVTVPPEEGYGVYNEALIRKVPARKLPTDGGKIRVGGSYRVMTDQGPRILLVKAISGDYVTVDPNHPLAGKTLTFKVGVVDVRDATEEELQHGHVHGPGGAHG